MQVFIQLPNKTVAVTAESQTTFAELARMTGSVLFMNSGILMNPEQTIEILPQRATLVAMANIDGAGKDKKRKKKVKKTPKHKSHVQKKVKLAVVNYYSVKGDNVDSLREYCKNCGAGVRLANHKDRKHCGKCGWNGKA